MNAEHIYDDEAELPSNVRPLVRPARAARPKQVTCPYCGNHDTASRVDHPSGAPWFCSCGSLFTGSDDEWRRLAEHRRMAAERRAQPQQGGAA